jgi:hypothetical protein
MHKVEILEKHCTTSKDGMIALSNTFVETAIKIHNCPIKVTCADYPGEESIYSVDVLLRPSFTAGPFQNKFGPGEDYYKLHMYPWIGTPIKEEEKVEKEQEIAATEPVLSITKDRTYTVETTEMRPVTVKSSTTFWGYIGHVIRSKREELNLTDRQVVEKIISQQGKDKYLFSINTYRAIEKGEDTNSKINTYIYIAEALDLHISELIPPKN